MNKKEEEIGKRGKNEEGKRMKKRGGDGEEGGSMRSR
jgi:hypothetical protein